MGAFRGGDFCRWCYALHRDLFEVVRDAGPMQAQELGFAVIVEYGGAESE